MYLFVDQHFKYIKTKNMEISDTFQLKSRSVFAHYIHELAVIFVLTLSKCLCSY